MLGAAGVEQLSSAGDFDYSAKYSGETPDDRFRINEYDSDEDTEDASETDMIKEEEYSEVKEQVYQEKLSNLKKQLQMLKDGCHPEYEKRLKKLEQQHKERDRLNEIWRKYELECVERDYVYEKKAAAREFDDKKVELKENLVFELEEKKKNVETERLTMDFTGDLVMDVKPITTRKLRRRPNDPVPVPEKRRKTSPSQLNFLLDEQQIYEDLKTINKGKLYIPKKTTANDFDFSGIGGGFSGLSGAAGGGGVAGIEFNTVEDCLIEDNKLYYDKRCYQRGQSIYVESKENGRFSAVISSVGTLDIWVRKNIDSTKIRIPLAQLQKGKYVIRKKST
ncbi:Sin3 histone deacetylase corepressor complex component SDS3 [Chamberlinius hualienensis]